MLLLLEMKTILDKLSDEKAQKELKRFAYASFIISIVTLFIFWWLSVVGIALGLRALLLTYHKGNKERKDLVKLRVMSIVAIVLGATSLIAGWILVG